MEDNKSNNINDKLEFLWERALALHDYHLALKIIQAQQEEKYQVNETRGYIFIQGAHVDIDKL